MAAAVTLKNRKMTISRQWFDIVWPNLARRRNSTLLSVRSLKIWNFKNMMAAAVILKNRKIAMSWQWLDLLPRNLARWCSLTLLTIQTAATSMQHICAIMNFSIDSLQHVGGCACVIFLFLTKFMHTMSHLFMIMQLMLPNAYTIAKLWLVHHHFFVSLS